MRNRNHIRLAIILSVLCSFGLAHAQEAAPPSPTTIFNRLGFPEGFRKLRGNLTNRRGNNPQREPKVPMKALNNPANLAEEMPPIIQEAAKVKIQEDLAPMKIKAIKYLTSIGCACYDKTGDITKALIGSSEDCTEEVRLATMEAVYEAAQGKCCANCGTKCCCKPELTLQLSRIAYDRDDAGCYIEPSKRVRDAARRALFACCPNAEPVTEIEPEELPKPEQPERPEGPEENAEGAEGQDESAESADTLPDGDDDATGSEESPDVINLETSLPSPREARRPAKRAQVTTVGKVLAPSSSETQHGVIVDIDRELRIAHVHLFNAEPLPKGTRLMAVVENGENRHWLGPLQVYQSFEDSANVTAARSVDFGRLSVGSQVVATLELKTAQAAPSRPAPVPVVTPQRRVATSQPAPIRPVTSTPPATTTRDLAPVVPAHRPVAPVIHRVMPASAAVDVSRREIRFDQVQQR